MRISPNIFREFSIRGVAEQDLTNDVVFLIGRAIGTFFRQQDRQRLVVGRDVRQSSVRISHSLTAGMVQSGIDVIDLGLVPTPVHNFATDFFGADGGAMVTASHNPPEDNGLKIRSWETLAGEAIQQIYRIAVSGDFISGEGTVSAKDAYTPYQAALKRYMATGRSLKVVVDAGNGANGPLVVELLRQHGHIVVELFIEPDGAFPNRSPDPTKAGATGALAALVQSEKADLGLAYDGDGDRLVVVDELGNRVLGDQILMILARDILRNEPAKIVYEILCTQALADDVLAHGGEPVMTPSGYAFVHQAMRDTGAAVGGELSGHLFFNEPEFRFDDAILGTVKLLNILSQSPRPLSVLVAELPSYHSSPELRVKCPDEAKSRVVEQVKVQFENDYKVDTLDGARIHFKDGWALVRQSNTQPVISMRFEARSREQLDMIQNKVQSLVEAEISRQIRILNL